MLSIFVSPHRKLYLEGEAQEDYTELQNAFVRGSGHGLLFLDVAVGTLSEEISIAYWKDFARLYLSLFSATPDLDKRDLAQNPLMIRLPQQDLSRLLLTVPPMKGAEYVDEECLLKLWEEIGSALSIEILDAKTDISSFFAARHSDWSLLGRVCFHLAENKHSEDTPFAFLATYAHQIADGRTKHLSLSMALEEYSAAEQKNLLLRLLAPIHKASQESTFLKAYIDSGDIYHPLAWTAREAYQFLKDSPLFEKAGIVTKIPNWWKPKHSSPKIELRLGENKPVEFGMGTLLDFNMSIMLGEKELNEKDIQELLLKSENLVFFRGQWVEVDKTKLNDLLVNWKKINKHMQAGGITFSEGVRWLSGMQAKDDNDTDIFLSTRVIHGKWLGTLLDDLKNPQTRENNQKILDEHLHATLRHYQDQGVAWLNMLNQLKLGAILADDMGLGKTLQVIALLLLKKWGEGKQAPSLLVIPASLIGNWKAEITKFAPSLRYWIAHQSVDGVKEPTVNFDLMITTYGSVAKYEWIMKRNWEIIVLDEAQAIKNPDAKQTRAIKSLNGTHKIALTGTPVENRLSDLWSLFDYISPGLLGTIKEFGNFMKQHNKPYAALRSLISPYILRRMKTDKKIISDLPDKTELKIYCQFSEMQVTLYQQAVESLKKDIENVEGIERRGVILSYLIRFKQICNHPSQWLKDGIFAANQSGKFARLKEMCEIISEKQEKLLVFTQFKEMTEPLAGFLNGVFRRKGLVLHGGTDIKKRTAMVESFQKEDGAPYFVLSLKAGGIGLNLTAASHVIHFDRWWNPAIENQATDRAFRIGQKRNVLVHKFICKGTLEEQIDMLIDSKLELSKEILETGGGALLTELSNKDLLKIVSLDINSALGEA